MLPKVGIWRSTRSDSPLEKIREFSFGEGSRWISVLMSTFRERSCWKAVLEILEGRSDRTVGPRQSLVGCQLRVLWVK